MSDAVNLAIEYLGKKGYPFEMKVASVFRKAGIGVYQSVYYSDPNTAISREMDIVAISIQSISSKNFNVVFVVECKYAESPWILFSSDSQGFPLQYVYSRQAERWVNHLSAQADFSHFFEYKRNFGYGVTAMHKKTESKENAHTAIQSVLGFLKSELANPRFAQTQDSVLYVPIIAIKGKLVKSSLDTDGTLKCEEISEAQLIYHENIYGVNPKIHLITEDALETYIARLAEDCQRLSTSPFITDSIVNPPFRSSISLIDRAPRITP